MSNDNVWMPLYVPDYLRDTGHLTTAEHGAYLLLLMQAWTRRGALPGDDDRLRMMARLDRREWAKAREAVLAFFVRDGDSLRNPRLDRELVRAAEIITERQKAGRAGAAKRWQGNGKPIANATANACQTQWQTDAPLHLQLPEEEESISFASQTHPSKPGANGRKPKPKLTSDFVEFWRLYPRKIGKGQAEKAWLAALNATGNDAEPIILGLKVALSLDRLDMREDGRFCPHPATWLNGKRWLDGMEPEPDAQPSLIPQH